MEKIIIEEYIPGIELHTAVLLNEAIGTMEIRPKNKFYDYEAKYADGFAEHIFPAKIPDNIYRMTLEHALKVHQLLGCKTVSRSDFRYNPQNNTLKMLEINTHPGFTELSLVPEIAKLTKGIDFNELIKIIVKDSLHHKNIRDQADVEQCY
ncbi:MAG: D-alanine--D-alanine ligase, partial [Wolbachia sp.]